MWERRERGEFRRFVIAFGVCDSREDALHKARSSIARAGPRPIRDQRHGSARAGWHGGIRRGRIWRREERIGEEFETRRRGEDGNQRRVIGGETETDADGLRRARAAASSWRRGKARRKGGTGWRPATDPTGQRNQRDSCRCFARSEGQRAESIARSGGGWVEGGYDGRRRGR